MSEPNKNIECYLYLLILQCSPFTYVNILYANTTGNSLTPKKPLLYCFSTSLDKSISDQAEFTHYYLEGLSGIVFCVIIPYINPDK